MKDRLFLAFLLMNLGAAIACRTTKQRALDIARRLTPEGVIAGCGTPIQDYFEGGDPPSRDLVYRRDKGGFVRVEFFHNKSARLWMLKGVAENLPGGVSIWSQDEDRIGDNLLAVFPCLDSPATAASLPHPDTPPNLQLFPPRANGLTVTFTGLAQGTTPGANVDSTSWDFGDDSPVMTADFPVSHTFPHPGPFSVKVVATDAFGLTRSATIVATASSEPSRQPAPPTPPTVQLFPVTVNGLTATINGVTLPTTPGATIASISWNFGDGSAPVSSWFPARHTFPRPGAFVVTVVTSDSNGLTESVSVTVMVSGQPKA
jgi:PKD domain